MTTLIPFSPNPITAFQSPVTLDGVQYTMTVTWNVYRQDWYVAITALDGTLVVTKPVVGSPDPLPLSSLVWTQSGLGASVLAGASATLPQAPGSLVNLVLANSVPSGYNGAFLCAVADRNTFSYPLATDPGQATSLGTYSPDIDILAGYFTSTLVWRPSNGWFEVSP